MVPPNYRGSSPGPSEAHQRSALLRRRSGNSKTGKHCRLHRCPLGHAKNPQTGITFTRQTSRGSRSNHHGG